MPGYFDKYAEKGNEVITILAEDLQVPQDKAGRILRSVLHALRKRVSIEESFQLLAQLPMALKSIYVEGWKPFVTYTRIQHLKDFLDEIREEDGKLAGYDFGNDEKAKQAVKAVFRILDYFISEGEMQDLIGMLPSEIKKFIHTTLDKGKMVL